MYHCKEQPNLVAPTATLTKIIQLSQEAVSHSILFKRIRPCSDNSSAPSLAYLSAPTSPQREWLYRKVAIGLKPIWPSNWPEMSVRIETVKWRQIMSTWFRRCWLMTSSIERSYFEAITNFLRLRTVLLSKAKIDRTYKLTILIRLWLSNRDHSQPV